MRQTGNNRYVGRLALLEPLLVFSSFDIDAAEGSFDFGVGLGFTDSANFEGFDGGLDLQFGYEWNERLHVDATVDALAVSPDGETLAAGLENGTVHLWRKDTWERSFELESFDGGVTAVTFSPDGRRIAAASASAIRVFDMVAGTMLMSFEDEGTSAIAYSPDGLRLATGTDAGNVRVWHTVRQELLLTLQLEDAVDVLTFSADGDRLLGIYGGEGTGRVWDTSPPRSSELISIPDRPSNGVLGFAIRNGVR